MSAIIVLSPDHAADAARNIVGALAESDLDVFLLQTGKDTSENIALDQLHQSRCAILLWSRTSLDPNAKTYRSLASLAAQTGKAILVRLDKASVPADLEKLTVYDLRGWRARQSSLFMLDLVAAAKSKAAGLDPPLQRAPRQLLMKRLAVAVPSAIAAIALIVGLYRDAGLDRIAGPSERAAWAARAKGSCSDLRTFLGKFPDGAYAPEAKSLLQARTEMDKIVNRPNERELAVYASERDAIAQSNEGAARSEALERAQTQAQKSCSLLARGSEAIFKSVKLAEPAVQCSTAAGGFTCRVNAVAICALDEPEPVRTESCHGG